MGSDPKEWWPDSGYCDEVDADECAVPTLKACRCCGARDLHWQQVAGKWRLFHEDDGVHVCAVRPLPQDKAAP